MQYLKSSRVVIGKTLQPAVILYKAGSIVATVKSDEIPADCHGIDFGDLVVMPGLIDSHVHINEPGRTDWEGFETGTMAAAAGGITSLVDMPLNCSPATTNAEALETKRQICRDKIWVDCGFYGGLIEGNHREMDTLCRGGVLAIKAFLCDSGIEDFPKVDESDLQNAMTVLARYQIPLLVHAELEDKSPSLYSKLKSHPTVYDAFLQSRPPVWESNAIDLLIRLCRKYDAPVHIVHLSAAEAVPTIASARAEGLPISVETCPHYLYFSAEEIPDGDTRFKCTPPIREKANQDLLWHGVETGLIDSIGSDHSPCQPGLKDLNGGSFLKAWGGISSLQLLLPATWTAARKRGNMTIPQLSELISSNPARRLNITNKGTFEPGKDADFVVWDPEADFRVDVDGLFHRHKVTPYLDHSLQGVVRHTYLRGQPVYSDGKIIGSPTGRTI